MTISRREKAPPTCAGNGGKRESMPRKKNRRRGERKSNGQFIRGKEGRSCLYGTGDTRLWAEKKRHEREGYAIAEGKRGRNCLRSVRERCEKKGE